MADRFDQVFRAGSARLAMNTNPKHPSEIRAGGERRRRRRIAAVASAAALVVAGLGGTAYAAGWRPSPSHSAATSSPSPGPSQQQTPSHRASPSHRPSPSHPATRSPSGRPSHGPAGEPSGRSTSGGQASGECDLDAMKAVTINGAGVGSGHGLSTVSMTYGGPKPCTLPTAYPELVYRCAGEASAEPDCRLPARHGTYFDGASAKVYGGTIRPRERVMFDLGTVSEPSAGEKKTYSQLRIVTQSGSTVYINGESLSSTGGVSVSKWYHMKN